MKVAQPISGSHSVAYLGGGAMVRPPWSDPEFLDNFCTVFVSFDSRLNRKMCVPRFLVTVRVFCLLQAAAKCTQTYHFGGKNYFFFWEEAQFPPPHPTPVDAFGPVAPSLLKS